MKKPSIQAIERPSGYIETDSGDVVRALKSTYKRHGTLNLFFALEVNTGHVRSEITEYKKRADFQNFPDGVIADIPPDKEIHVILDNYSTHRKNDDWLAKFEGRVQFHFTPTSASWLNQIDMSAGGVAGRVGYPDASPRRREGLQVLSDETEAMEKTNRHAARGEVLIR